MVEQTFLHDIVMVEQMVLLLRLKGASLCF